MSERIVSPGVFTRESDLSFIEQGVGEIGAAIVGPFKQGPAFIPTQVRSQAQFENIFGRPDGTYYTEETVRNYLRESGVVTVVRVAGVDGYEHDLPIGIYASSSEGEKLVGTMHSTYVGSAEEGGFVDTTIDDLGEGDGRFTISGSVLGPEVITSIDPQITNRITEVFGTSALGERNAYVYTYFPSASRELVSGSGSVVSLEELPTQDFSYDASPSKTPWVTSQEIASEERYNLFRFVTRGYGNVYNRKYKVSISNVVAAGEATGTDFATFTVTIRSFDDTDRRKDVIESYNNVTMDPASPNYIARVIGNMDITITEDGKIEESGEYPNRSELVRVEVADPDAYPVSVAPFGHEAYYNPFATDGKDEDVPPVIFQTSSLENDATSTFRFSGFDFEDGWARRDNHNYLKPIPDGATKGANEHFGLDSDLGLDLTKDNLEDIAQRQFTLAFQGGFDGKSPAIPNQRGKDISAGNSQGFDLTDADAFGTKAYIRAIRAVSNPDEWDINMLATPGIVRAFHPLVVDTAIDMVESRQDAFYITELAGADSDIQTVVDEANMVDSNYAATYYPWVRTVDSATNKMVVTPPSVMMPGVFAASDRLSAEWFAPAGLNRGGLTQAVSVLNRLTHTERDTLYENKVNPIATFPGQGIVAFGQKTLQDRASALDRINVRRLLINLKKFIASTSRFLVFEQNTSTTRNRFLNTVNPYMESIQQRQGLYAFRVVMDESNNTPDVIDRNIMKGEIFLQPTRTAEFIVIDFNIMPTGAEFGE